MELLYISLFLTQCVFYALADACVSAKHKIVNTQDSISLLDRKSFVAPANTTDGYYRSMILDDKNGRLIVGSKDYVFYLNSTTLDILHTEEWSSSDSHKECKNSIDTPSEYCGNYITYLDIYKDKLLLCGTGSTKPTQKVIALSNYTSLSYKTADTVCASPNPDHRVVGKITDLGELIAATYKDVEGTHSEVVGNYVTEEMTVYRTPLTTSKRKSIADNAEFIYSTYIEDSVYVFFMEPAEENDGTSRATVGRFCQTDNGGQTYLDSRMWTTFRKSRLNCKYYGENDFMFHNLVDVTYDEIDEIFYAAFTMTKSEDNLASAVCSFTRKEIEESIFGDFLKKDKKTGKWKTITSGGFLNGCKVNPKDLTDKAATSRGKEPTNSLNFQATYFAANNHLMAKEVNTRSDIFQFIKPVTKFSRITLDRVTAANNTDITILGVIDEHGKLLMVYNNKANKASTDTTACVIEEIETSIVNPKKLLMNEKNRMIYTSSDEHVYAYNVDSCQRYASESSCISAHNPRCGWSKELVKCISWKDRSSSSNSSWSQSLIHCPVRKDFFSSWLPWKACQQGTSGRYCLCRQRRCHSCNLNVCGSESSTEIANCTINPVSNVEKWLAEGSIDGTWSSWKEWSVCEKNGKCGNESMTRYRGCTSPSPANGGRDCMGNNFECTTCLKKPEIFHIFWSGWSTWSDCKQISDDYYEQERTRQCSKPNQCIGEKLEKQQCVPEGMLWGEWTNCSCMQKVQHRYPTFITGCKDCTRLKMPQYRTCEPVGCPTVKPPNTTTPGENTTKKVVVVVPIQPEGIPNQKEFKDGYTFNLRDIIIIGCGIVVSCFVIIVFVILVMRRNAKKHFYVPNKIKTGALLGTDTLDSNGDQTSNA